MSDQNNGFEVDQNQNPNQQTDPAQHGSNEQGQNGGQIPRPQYNQYGSYGGQYQYGQYQNGNQYNYNPQGQGYNYQWQGNNAKPPKKNGGLKAFAIAATACLLVVLILLTAVLYNQNSADNPQGGTSQSSGSAESNDASSDTKSDISYNEYISQSPPIELPASEYAEIYEKCSQSCVSVITNSALGSGFVIDENGHIMTNHHVIEGAKTIKVRFYNGDEYTAELIGSDDASDVAVLKIDAEGLVPIEIGDSDAVKVGDSVSAIGTPYDLSLAGTMTPGIISGIARDIEVTNDYGTVVKTMTLLQTSTPINPGNSGGPLINMAGQVIGITTLKLMDEYEGLGFAIPINSAVTIANIILTHGEVIERPDDDIVTVTPKLNITIINSEYAVEAGYFTSTPPEGVMVVEISRRSAIYQAGLELYDVIYDFNGKSITSKEDLASELKKYSAGQTVTIKVYRSDRRGENWQSYDITFKLESAS